MNKISLENCFTAGELASLFGISKQTLLYYDRIKLLCPDFISDNGYRHYSINQYLDLEIIVNLRSLNIPISDIKEYLEHRNKSEFIKQLEKKRAECQSIIKENERIMASIDFIEGNLAQHKNLPLGQITVSWREERLLRLTNVLSTDNGKKRISKFAHQAFFSFSEHQKGHYKTPRTPLPMGLYLELYFKGTYSTQAAQLKEKIYAFMQRNDFAPCSNIYVLPIENHWLNEDTNNYINLIFLQVQSTKIV